MQQPKQARPNFEEGPPGDGTPGRGGRQRRHHLVVLIRGQLQPHTTPTTPHLMHTPPHTAPTSILPMHIPPYTTPTSILPMHIPPNTTPNPQPQSYPSDSSIITVHFMSSLHKSLITLHSPQTSVYRTYYH